MVADGTDEPVVLGEELRFRCETKGCAVTATYRIHVASDRRISTALILPAQKRVTVRHGSRVITVVPVVAPEIPWPDAAYWGQVLPPLYKAAFAVELAKGENSVTVEYVQPLAARERGHSYFRDGVRIKMWSYELWPLGEWQRKPGMQIRISIDVPRKPPSRWKRWYGSGRRPLHARARSERRAGDLGELALRVGPGGRPHLGRNALT